MFLCGTGMFENVMLDNAGLAVFISMLAAIVLAAVLFNVAPLFVNKWRIVYETRDLTYGAVCLALAYALSWVGITLPAGGTITIASLVPVFIYCYYFGFRKGMIVTAAYTLLQFTQHPYIVTPLSALLDYIIPYGSLCIVGLFAYKPERFNKIADKNKAKLGDGAKGTMGYWARTLGGHWGIFVGVVIHMLIRYASQVASGVVFYELYYGENASLAFKLSYSFGYNAYGLADSAIAVAALVVLLSSRTFDYFMSSAFSKKNRKTAPAVAAETAAIADNANAQIVETACAEPQSDSTEKSETNERTNE